MKRLALAGLIALVVVGCGGSKPAAESTAESPATPATSSEATAAASGCRASGLDAMTSLSDFQLELDKAQKEGKITLDQLLAARDKLFGQTQAAQEKEDWATYCQAIDDTRAELKL